MHYSVSRTVQLGRLREKKEEEKEEEEKEEEKEKEEEENKGGGRLGWNAIEEPIH